MFSLKKLLPILLLLLMFSQSNKPIKNIPICYANMNYVILSLTEEAGILSFQDTVHTEYVRNNFTITNQYFKITCKSMKCEKKDLEYLCVFLYPDNGEIKFIGQLKNRELEGIEITIQNGNSTSICKVKEGYFILKLPLYESNSFMATIQKENMKVKLTNFLSIDIKKV